MIYQVLIDNNLYLQEVRVEDVLNELSMDLLLLMLLVYLNTIYIYICRVKNFFFVLFLLIFDVFDSLRDA